MTAIDLQSIMPMIVMAITAGVVLLVISLRRDHTAAFFLTLLGNVVAFLELFSSNEHIPHRLGDLLIVDQYSQYFMGLILILSTVAAIFVFSYFRSSQEHKEELYVLILISSIGASVLSASVHFVAFILGLEILTVALYVMIAYLRRRKIGIEAAIKYLILAAAASAFLLLGAAFIYAELGSLGFSALIAAAENPGSYNLMYLLAGTGLFIVGIGFKLGVVPFHMWTPDIYQGAPAPVTAFIASVSKAAVIAVFLRYLIDINIVDHPILLTVVSIIAVLSMIFGNLLALMQSNLKRLLAYSSIAHLGYLLVALIASGSRGAETAIYYITVYSVTILGSFGIISLVSNSERERTAIEDYRGLFWSNPAPAAFLSIMIFSLAGIPLTAGFISKYFVILTGINSFLWISVFVLIVTSVVGLYYYLRVIAIMLAETESTERRPFPSLYSLGNRFILLVIAAFIIFFGIYPQPLIDLIKATVLRSFG